MCNVVTIRMIGGGERRGEVGVNDRKSTSQTTTFLCQGKKRGEMKSGMLRMLRINNSQTVFLQHRSKPMTSKVTHPAGCIFGE